MKNFKVHVRKYCGDYETAYLPFLVNKTSGLRSTQLTSSKVSILQSYQALFANQPSLKAAFDYAIPAAVKILRDMTKRKLVKMFKSVVPGCEILKTDVHWTFTIGPSHSKDQNHWNNSPTR